MAAPTRTVVSMVASFTAAFVGTNYLIDCANRRAARLQREAERRLNARVRHYWVDRRATFHRRRNDAATTKAK